jgi:hypothetical protein
MNVCELTLAVSHPHRSRTGTAGWVAWRMLWRVRERSRPSSPSQLWVVGSLSSYDVIIYLFCIELLLCSKDVTFDPVPWFIICVRLGPTTPGDYFTPGFWTPKTRVWQELNNFTRNEVWHLVSRPNQNVVGTKWVFRNKQDEHGVVTRNKSRLVAKGYS